MASAVAAKFNPEVLKDKTEEQLLEWSKASKDHWGKIEESIGAGSSDTLEDLSDVASEDYEEKIHELTISDQLKPMEVAKLFKLVNAVRASQSLEPADLKPLSAKRARLTPAAEKGDELGSTDPLQDVPHNYTGRAVYAGGGHPCVSAVTIPTTDSHRSGRQG